MLIYYEKIYTLEYYCSESLYLDTARNSGVVCSWADNRETWQVEIIGIFWCLHMHHAEKGEKINLHVETELVCRENDSSGISE